MKIVVHAQVKLFEIAIPNASNLKFIVSLQEVRLFYRLLSLHFILHDMMAFRFLTPENFHF